MTFSSAVVFFVSHRLCRLEDMLKNGPEKNVFISPVIACFRDTKNYGDSFKQTNICIELLLNATDFISADDLIFDKWQAS